MNTKEKIKVMQHFEDGGKIQKTSRNKDNWNDWEFVHAPAWSWNMWTYRIKPKPVELLYEFIYWQRKNNSFRTNDKWLTKDEIHSRGYDNYLFTGRALNQDTHEIETKEFGVE